MTGIRAWSTWCVSCVIWRDPSWDSVSSHISSRETLRSMLITDLEGKKGNWAITCMLFGVPGALVRPTQLLITMQSSFWVILHSTDTGSKYYGNFSLIILVKNVTGMSFWRQFGWKLEQIRWKSHHFLRKSHGNSMTWPCSKSLSCTSMENE